MRDKKLEFLNFIQSVFFYFSLIDTKLVTAFVSVSVLSYVSRNTSYSQLASTTALASVTEHYNAASFSMKSNFNFSFLGVTKSQLQLLAAI